MTIWYKQGAVGDLHPIAQKGLGKVARLYKNAYGEDLFVTSLRDGNHLHGSLHYVGRAFDIRAPGTKHNIDIKTRLQATLGDEWDVVVESTHIHCEHDPKFGALCQKLVH